MNDTTTHPTMATREMFRVLKVQTGVWYVQCVEHSRLVSPTLKTKKSAVAACERRNDPSRKRCGCPDPVTEGTT